MNLFKQSASRYNLLLNQESPFRRKKVIGTIECIPYDPCSPNRTVEGNGRFPFSTYKETNMHKHLIWGIDKLCIHQDYQRQWYFKVLLYIIIYHATQNNVKYYLALIEQKLYRMLKILAGSSVEQKGDVFISSSAALIPATIDIQRSMDDNVRVKRLMGELA